MMLSPSQYHRSRHPGGGTFGECWRCARARAICRSKIRFTSWAEADEWVTEFNESHEYARPVTRYCCRWCEGWHMTTAHGPIGIKRMERQRRKWLLARRESR